MPARRVRGNAPPRLLEKPPASPTTGNPAGLSCRRRNKSFRLVFLASNTLARRMKPAMAA
jgi:hypothetical protein